MPAEVEETEEEGLLDVRPVPELAHIHGLRLNPNSREIFIIGEISEDFQEWFATSFRYLVSLNNKPIIIWLSTGGGLVEGSYVFHDLVRASSAHVIIIGTGSIASAGVLMLACGHKRYVTESCVVMSHEGSISWEEGRYSEIKDRRKFEDWNMTHWYELMGRYSKDKSYWKNVTSKQAEYWILGGAAIVEEGLADAVLTQEILDSIFK